RGGEPAIAKQMVVEKIQMASGQTFDFGERRIDRLRIKSASAFEERFLVAEVTDVRAPARHHDRVRNEIQSAMYQVAPYWRHASKRPRARSIHLQRTTRAKIVKKCRPRVLAGSQKNRVGMRRRLGRHRRDVQSSERDMCPQLAIMIRET